MDSSIRDTIARVAREEGIDPAYALAVAERESSLNPNAHASKTIYGLFQMNGGERAKYGSGNSADPEAQTRAFAGYTRNLRDEMTQQLGRAPTSSETYLGHFWGGPRASRVINGAQAGLSPQDMFTRRELAENPELAKGSSAGGLASSIMGDISRRQAKFGGGEGQAPGIHGNSSGNPMDFASFGQPLDEPGAPGKGTQVASNDVNFAQFGRAQDEGSSPPPTNNYDAAHAAMKLNPQEQALYKRHLQNLYGPGGVDNPPTKERPYPTRSTLYEMTADMDGKTYVLPTVYDGKILSKEDAVQRAKQDGIEQFPTYANEAEAKSRYDQMHDYMTKDTIDYYGTKPQAPVRPGSEIDVSQFGVAANTIRPSMPPQQQPSAPAQIIDDYNATADFKNRPLPPQYQELNEQNENNSHLYT